MFFLTYTFVLSVLIPQFYLFSFFQCLPNSYFFYCQVPYPYSVYIIAVCLYIVLYGWTKKYRFVFKLNFVLMFWRTHELCTFELSTTTFIYILYVYILMYVPYSVVRSFTLMWYTRTYVLIKCRVLTFRDLNMHTKRTWIIYNSVNLVR